MSHLVPKITHVQPYGIANSLIIAKESEIAFKGVDSLSYKLNTPPYDSPESTGEPRIPRIFSCQFQRKNHKETQRTGLVI